MNQNPKQFARDITNADHFRCGRAIHGKNKIDLNKATFVAIKKYQTGIRDAGYILFAASKLLCLIYCRSLKETMGTGAFPISKILYLKKPIK